MLLTHSPGEAAGRDRAGTRSVAGVSLCGSVKVT